MIGAVDSTAKVPLVGDILTSAREDVAAPIPFGQLDSRWAYMVPIAGHTECATNVQNPATGLVLACKPQRRLGGNPVRNKPAMSLITDVLSPTYEWPRKLVSTADTSMLSRFGRTTICGVTSPAR